MKTLTIAEDKNKEAQAKAHKSLSQSFFSFPLLRMYQPNSNLDISIEQGGRTQFMSFYINKKSVDDQSLTDFKKPASYLK